MWPASLAVCLPMTILFHRPNLAFPYATYRRFEATPQRRGADVPPQPLRNVMSDVIDGSTHISLIVDEDDTAATTQAILDVVSSVRSARPLVR